MLNKIVMLVPGGKETSSCLSSRETHVDGSGAWAFTQYI